jgi:hypothetical protein
MGLKGLGSLGASESISEGQRASQLPEADQRPGQQLWDLFPKIGQIPMDFKHAFLLGPSKWTSRKIQRDSSSRIPPPAGGTLRGSLVDGS